MTQFDLETQNVDLADRKVAVLATDGFEESELVQPVAALERAGAEVRIVSIPETSDTIRGWADRDWSDAIEVDGTIEDYAADDFDALMIPGGVMNPDSLRTNEDAVDFVRSFFEEGKPVASICHGPWLIIEVGAAEGRRMTAYRSLRTDVKNAGGQWEDRSVVVDSGLVTSRNPSDLGDFIYKLIEEVGEGVHAGQHA